MKLRLLIGGLGVLLALFGAYRLLTQISHNTVLMIFIWLVGALIIHDGIVSPIVVGVGWVISKVVPARARAFVQGGLVMAAAVTVIAIFEIHRENSQPPEKAILRQNYAGNLGVLLAIIAALCVVGYVLRVVQQQRRHARRPLPR